MNNRCILYVVKMCQKQIKIKKCVDNVEACGYNTNINTINNKCETQRRT